MRISTVGHGVNVVLEENGVKSTFDDSLSKRCGVVVSLSTRSDFLTSHEEIIRQCIVRIVVAFHRVEGSCGYWVPVHHVEISVVFLFDEGSEFFLSDSVDIF